MDVNTLFQPLVEGAPPPLSLDDVRHRARRRRRHRRLAIATSALLVAGVVATLGLLAAGHNSHSTVRTAGKPQAPVTEFTHPSQLPPLFTSLPVPDESGLSVTVDGGTATLSVTTEPDGTQKLCIVDTIPEIDDSGGSMCGEPGFLRSISSGGTSTDGCADHLFLSGLTVADAQAVTIDNHGEHFDAKLVSKPGFPATLFLARITGPPLGDSPDITVTDHNNKTIRLVGQKRPDPPQCDGNSTSTTPDTADAPTTTTL